LVRCDVVLFADTRFSAPTVLGLMDTLASVEG
jgi:hypothetical protein